MFYDLSFVGTTSEILHVSVVNCHKNLFKVSEKFYYTICWNDTFRKRFTLLKDLDAILLHIS